jgi:hypothetical protein
MTQTCNQMIDETLRLVLAGTREQLNVLSGALTANAASATFLYPLQSINQGAIIAIDTEEIYIVSVSGQSATISRGYNGSTAAIHADAAVVNVNPKFSRWRIFNELNNVLDELSSRGLFQMKTATDLTYVPAVEGYSLGALTDVQEPYEVRAQVPGPSKSWPVVGRELWDLRRDADTSDFALGLALNVKAGAPGMRVQFLYKAPFVRFTTTASDAQADAGLPATANDIPPMAAAVRLVLPREVARNFFETQGDTRRPSEVPSGANANAAVTWTRLIDQRITKEAQRLHLMWPERRY